MVSNVNKDGGRSLCSSVLKMFTLSLSVLLGWTEGEGKCSSVTTSLTQPESVSVFYFVYTDLLPSSVVKTQSRRQSVLVCSLLVVSLLLSAAVGGEGELRDLSICTPYRVYSCVSLCTGHRTVWTHRYTN